MSINPSETPGAARSSFVEVTSGALEENWLVVPSDGQDPTRKVITLDLEQLTVKTNIIAEGLLIFYEDKLRCIQTIEERHEKALSSPELLLNCMQNELAHDKKWLRTYRSYIKDEILEPLEKKIRELEPFFSTRQQPPPQSFLRSIITLFSL